MGSVSGAVIFGETSHRALLQLFDPLDFSLKTIADIDGEPGVFGVENVPFWATFKGVCVSLDKVFKSIDPTVELSHFGHVVVLTLLDCFEQGLGDALQGVGVEVGAAVENVSS